MSVDARPNGTRQNANTLDNREPAGSNDDAGSVTPNRVAMIVAVAVLIVYVAALLLLFVNRADKQWDRIVYLFSGYEAVVFVAVGAIFGTSVQRGAVKSAEARTQQAEQENQAARERADRAETGALRGQALADSIRGVGSRSGSAGPGDRDRPGLRGGTGNGTGLETLVHLADSLFPAER